MSSVMTTKNKKTAKERLEEIANADALFSIGFHRYDGFTQEKITGILLADRKFRFDLIYTPDECYSDLLSELLSDPKVREAIIDEMVRKYYIPAFFKKYKQLAMKGQEVD